ncbi:hypothetical protein [Paenibacillus pinihumi]|uniref:hypothetical protein n=1 Tax=Paenibacillus pinihumi TaxID=669462 RepID=UPI0003FB253B|nr:hypothetical protein [Paenibacillus pinihumi]
MTVYLDGLIRDVIQNQVYAREVETSGQESGESASRLTTEMCMAGIERGWLELEQEKIAFINHQVWEGMLDFKLPDSLQLVPRGIARKDRKPDGHQHLLYELKEQGVILGLTLMKHPLQQEQVAIFHQEMMIQTKRSHPGMQIINAELLEQESGFLGCYESLFPMTNPPYFQVVFTLSLGEKACLGSFQFRLEDAEIWQPVSQAVIRSMSWQAGLKIN